MARRPERPYPEGPFALQSHRGRSVRIPARPLGPRPLALGAVAGRDQRLGAEVNTTSSADAGYLADDPDHPSRKLIRQILGAVNEYERQHDQNAAAARPGPQTTQPWLRLRPPPLGYRAEGHQLVAEDDEQMVAERIRVLRAGSRSLREVADMLTGEGFKPKRSTRWQVGSLRLIVDRLELEFRVKA
jgi:hypothetical protein